MKSSSKKSARAGSEPRLIQRIRAEGDDFAALLLSALTVVTILGLSGMTSGELVDWWTVLLWRWLGWGAVAVPAGFAGGVYLLIRRRLGNPVEIAWSRIIAIEIAYVALLGLMAILDGLSFLRAESGTGGGLIGWGIATVLDDVAGPWISAGIMLVVMGLGIAYGLAGPLGALLRWWERRMEMPMPAQTSLPEGGSGQAQASVAARKTAKRRRSILSLPMRYRKSFEVPEESETASRPIERSELLPAFTLLESKLSAKASAKEINLAAGLIEKTLADFGLPAQVVGFQTGPAVTQYAVEPGFLEQAGANGMVRRAKVRVSQISALAKDLALALSAPRLRIEAPVPGRSYIGIEVPNRHPTLVRLRPILESDAFQSVESPLALALGRDVAGTAVVADLGAMPHLLIAGTTGSGKSVCLASMITCLSFNNTPGDLRLVMIDPKMVELIRFNGLPHLLGKVETDLERIIGVLRWCTAEMDRRYRLLEEAKVRDIEAFNRKARRRRGVEPLPRIVVAIDELADLMMMAPDQTEKVLVRLAQMARAVGIHLVVATQRPSTEILTGLIKANFPARIAFSVASGVDSRVVLDAPGAETLLGKGDMLFLSPEASAAVRVQGVLVTDEEIDSLVSYWSEAVSREPAESSEPAPWEEMLERQAVLDTRDEIIERAIEVVKQTGEASASMLQRRLRIGYPRAARLMDELEELGVIGAPESGGRTREVLIHPDDDPFREEAQDHEEEQA